MSVYQRPYIDQEGRKRKTRTWHVEFMHEGERYRFSAGKNKKKAQEYEAIKKAEVIEGRYVHQAPKGTKKMKRISDAWDAWLIEKRDRSPAYIDTLKRYKKYFTDEWGSDFALKLITAEMVRLYQAKREGDGVGPVAINREVTALSGMLTFATQEGWIPANPIHRVRKMKEPPPRDDKFLDAEQQKSLIEACDEAIRPIIITVLNTGMRKQEILGLTWGQINLSDRIIRLPDTKSGRPQDAPLNRTMVDLLKGMMKDQMKDGIRPDSFVFCNPQTGTRWVDIRKPFYRALKATELKQGTKGWTFHDLRHAAGNHLIRGGADIYQVSQFLRHASVRTTEKYYAEAHREDKIRTAELLDHMASGA